MTRRQCVRYVSVVDKTHNLLEEIARAWCGITVSRKHFSQLSLVLGRIYLREFVLRIDDILGYD